MKMSGTSMASPNVANLAGKLLAVKPELSPSEVIDLIRRGADEKKAGDSTILLMNPKQSMALLQ
jgi:subtilisin family serine protease